VTRDSEAASGRASPACCTKQHVTVFDERHAAYRVEDLSRIRSVSDLIALSDKQTLRPPRAVIDTCQKRLRAFDQGMTMDAKQRKNLAKMGGRVATVQEFLRFSDPEVRLIDLRIQLTRELRERRTARKVTQVRIPGIVIGHSTAS
jgi:hypothetical protein